MHRMSWSRNCFDNIKLSYSVGFLHYCPRLHIFVQLMGVNPDHCKDFSALQKREIKLHISPGALVSKTRWNLVGKEKNGQ